MSRWADFGFPGIALQPPAGVYFALLLALRERYHAAGYDFEEDFYPNGGMPKYLSECRGGGYGRAQEADGICDGVFHWYVFPEGTRYRRASLSRCAEMLGEALINPRKEHPGFYPEWSRAWAYQRYRMINMIQLRIVSWRISHGEYFEESDGLEVEDVHGQFEFYDEIQ